MAIKWWFGKIFLSWFEFIYDNNPLPADHLRINKINDNSKRFILLYPIFRWINKIKLKYFVVKFSILLQNHLQYKNNKSYLQVKHINISKILYLDKLVKPTLAKRKMIKVKFLNICLLVHIMTIYGTYLIQTLMTYIEQNLTLIKLGTIQLY